MPVNLKETAIRQLSVTMTQTIARQGDLATYQTSGVAHRRLAPRPYDHAGLDAYIEARAIRRDHDKHHASCVVNPNAASEKGPALRERTTIRLLLDEVWEHACYLEHESRRFECLNAGQAVANWHEVPWRCMSSGDFAVQEWETEGGRLLDVAP